MDGVDPETWAAIVRQCADFISSSCFDHNPELTEGWSQCYCDMADELRFAANVGTF